MSSAIEIRPPPPSPPPEEQPVASSSKPATGNKLCRNVLIYGFCKHEDDGCMFQHPPKGEGAQTLSSASSPAASPVVTRSALYTQAANAPAFVPKSVTATGSTNDSGAPSPKLTSPTFSAATPAFIPGGSLANSAAKPGALATEAFSQLSLNAPSFNPSGSQPATPAPILYDEMEAYYPRHPTVRQPLDYHLYTTPLPHITNLHPSQLQIHSFFLSPTLREDLQRRSAALQESSPIPIPGLPDELHVYHSLHPLEAGTVGTTGPGGASMEKNKRVFGLGTEVYKGVCELDGNAYVLRRVENFKIMHDTAFAPIESWRRIRHPNVVSVREAFTTRLFGDHSVIFAYDYHPNSRTLFAEHFMPKPPAIGKNGRLQPQDMHIPEKVVWSYITQIANALKAIHSEGLAARMIDPSKILVTGRNRIRINCCGILDVVAYDGSQNALIQQQQEDLLSLGKLVLALTNLSVSAVQNLPKAMEILSRSYSAEIKNVVIFLLSKPGPMGKTVDELLAMLGARLLNELDAAQNYCDILESEMTRELENGRLVRLLCKFGFINERPEFDHDPRWSESGDRYILKLFRDMVFHQVDEHNKPVLDLSHVLTCLNKLDAGSDEKVMLMSRDEQSCLVVSYREIKGCVEAAFNDLARGTS